MSRNLLKRLEMLERSDAPEQTTPRLILERAREMLDEDYERLHGLMSPETAIWIDSIRRAVC